MTQPRMRPFRSARMAPHSCASSVAMPSAVSPKAPDSGSSRPRYCSKAAAMVAAMAAASAAVAARRTRVSLMVAFSRRLCLIGEEKPMGYQTIEVRKLSPVIGAEIFGVDLARPLGNQVFQEIHDALMDNLVIFFRDQELTHEQHKAFGRRFGDTPKEGGFPRSEHPVVRTHPVTGRKALYVNRNFTTHIAGLRKNESDALLEMLYRHSETPEFQCRFAWQPNSIAFWDNRAAMHHAMWDYFPHKRLGYRVTVKGDKPFYRA